MKKKVITVLILAGCSITAAMANPYAPVSMEDMQTKYKGLSVKEFLKKHYWEEISNKPLNKVGNAIGSFFDRMSQSSVVTPNPYYHEPAVKEAYDPATGAVTYAAIFNTVNSKMLYTPASDLKTFCEAGGGQLRPVIIGKKPDNLALDVARSVPLHPVVTPYNAPFYIASAGFAYAAEQEGLDRFREVHMRYAVLIDQAIRARAIGPFACVGGEDKPKWMAKVEPSAYEYEGRGEHNAQVGLKITPILTPSK